LWPSKGELKIQILSSIKDHIIHKMDQLTEILTGHTK
jgi:hypothetical protein